MKFRVEKVKPVIDNGVRGLCTRPYHAHPNGCPNFGQRNTCPPDAPLLKDVFDPLQPVWACWAEFDIGAHREKQRRKHPTWSERALVNPRHWQGTVRKFLREAVAGWLERNDYYTVAAREVAFTTCPEAMGVNVTATMKDIGVLLEWPPKNTTRLIYLLGVKK